MKRKQAAVLLQQLKAGEGRLTRREGFYFAFLLDAGSYLLPQLVLRERERGTREGVDVE